MNLKLSCDFLSVKSRKCIAHKAGSRSNFSQMKRNIFQFALCLIFKGSEKNRDRILTLNVLTGSDCIHKHTENSIHIIQAFLRYVTIMSTQTYISYQVQVKCHVWLKLHHINCNFLFVFLLNKAFFVDVIVLEMSDICLIARKKCVNLIDNE